MNLNISEDRSSHISDWGFFSRGGVREGREKWLLIGKNFASDTHKCLLES